jgi:hypothetical protein
MPVSFFYLYKKENKRHLMRVRFLPHGIMGTTGISVIYRVLGNDEPTPFMVQRNRSSQALNYYIKLCDLDLNLLFRCETNFINRRDEGTFIPFPMKVPPQSANSSFDEIRGMRIAKVKDNKILMENYMDLVDDNTLSQTIKFAYEAKFTLDLPLTIIQESRKLIQ